MFLRMASLDRYFKGATRTLRDKGYRSSACTLTQLSFSNSEEAELQCEGLSDEGALLLCAFLWIPTEISSGWEPLLFLGSWILRMYRKVWNFEFLTAASTKSTKELEAWPSGWLEKVNLPEKNVSLKIQEHVTISKNKKTVKSKPSTKSRNRSDIFLFLCWWKISYPPPTKKFKIQSQWSENWKFDIPFKFQFLTCIWFIS